MRWTNKLDRLWSQHLRGTWSSKSPIIVVSIQLTIVLETKRTISSSAGELACKGHGWSTGQVSEMVKNNSVRKMQCFSNNVLGIQLIQHKVCGFRTSLLPNAVAEADPPAQQCVSKHALPELQNFCCVLF